VSCAWTSGSRTQFRHFRSGAETRSAGGEPEIAGFGVVGDITRGESDGRPDVGLGGQLEKVGRYLESKKRKSPPWILYRRGDCKDDSFGQVIVICRDEKQSSVN